MPEIAKAAGLGLDMARLTQEALDGVVPFEVSFRQRFDLLRHVPLEAVWQVADNIEIDAHIGKFIQEHREQCVIATGNADLWVRPITDKLGCRVFASHAEIDENGIPQLLTVLYKGDVMQTLRAEFPPPTKLIAIGDSANDIPMFEAADFSIAYGGVNMPSPEAGRAASRQINESAKVESILSRYL